MLAAQDEAKVVLEGRISGDPEFSGRRVELTSDLLAANLGSGSVPAEISVLVYATLQMTWFPSGLRLTSTTEMRCPLPEPCAGLSPLAVSTTRHIWPVRA